MTARRQYAGRFFVAAVSRKVRGYCRRGGRLLRLKPQVRGYKVMG